MKKALIIFLIGVCALTMVACGSEKAAEEEKAEPEVVKIEKSIDAVAEALGLSGKSETFYDMIGAEDGAEFNDGTVEIYQYDPESKDYKDIEKGKGAIEAEACNSGFVLVIPDGTEPDQKLVKSFNELTF